MVSQSTPEAQVEAEFAAELEDIEKECERRIQILGSQGILVQGLDGHYVQTLLEVLLDDRLDIAKMKHMLWVREELDKVEAQVRKARLTHGVAGGVPLGQP